MAKTAIKAKIGVFGIGLAAYWPQFEGLKERLEGYQREVERNREDSLSKPQQLPPPTDGPAR